MKRFVLGVLAYVVPTFLLGFVWHLVVFAHKNVMTSVPDYLLIETAFTIVLWLMVGPLTVLAFHHPVREDARIRIAG
jgi:hypothetical protein